MELKHLQAFVLLAEELHFGRTAARLHIVQPALSSRIRALEESLGAQLFERDRHRVALTETGRLFLPEALATLRQAARARDVAKLSASGEIGQLRIAFVSSVLPELLPKLLQAMKERLPRLELELKDMSSPLQVSALYDATIDFGLIRLPLAQAGLQTRLLFEEPFVVALPAGDPLAAKQTVEAGDLAGRPVFVLARKYAPGLYDRMLVSFQHRQVTLQIGRELGEFTTLLALVASGLGLGIAPAGAAAALPPNVLARPLALESAGVGIGVAWTGLDDAKKRAFMGVLDALYPPAGGPGAR